MIKEEINKQLFDKIERNATVAIFGAAPIGAAIYKDILLNRKDVKVNCFIDNFKTGTMWDVPIVNLKKFLDTVKKGTQVIIASKSAQSLTANILDIYDIPFIGISAFIFDIYSGNQLILNDENFNKVIRIFSQDEDKQLFENLFKVKKHILPNSVMEEYFQKTYPKVCNLSTGAMKYQYLDKIEKEPVKIVFDLGFNAGWNSLADKKLLPNYKKTYAFEPIYEICRSSIMEEFLMDDNVTLVECAVGDKECKTKFYIGKDVTYDSFADFSLTHFKHDISKFKEIQVNTITLDKYCEQNNAYPDLIKMDIEGAELYALKGGINAIKKSRPQLAISIYHSDNDFINIPLYLFNNLENYTYRLGTYSRCWADTILYAIPNELIK